MRQYAIGPTVTFPQDTNISELQKHLQPQDQSASPPRPAATPITDSEKQPIDFLKNLLYQETESSHNNAATSLPSIAGSDIAHRKTTPEYVAYLSSAVAREADPMEIVPVFRAAVYRHVQAEGTTDRPELGLRNMFTSHPEIFLAYLYLQETQKSIPTGTMRMFKEHFGLCSIPHRATWASMTEHLPASLAERLGEQAAAAEALAAKMADRAPFTGSFFRSTLTELGRNNNLGGLERFYERAQTKKVMNEDLYAQFVGAFLGFHRGKERALEIWDEMIREGIVPSRKSWSYLMKYAKDEPPAVLLEIWDRMIMAGIQPDQHNWNTRVHLQFQNNHADEGMESIQLMIKCGKIPDTIPINSALVNLLNHDRMDLVAQLLQTADSLGIHPDTTTYNTLLGKVMQNGTYAAALSVLQDMERRGIRYDVYTFTVILNGLFKSQRSDLRTVMDDVLKILSFMETHSVPLNIATYTTIASGLLEMENHSAVRVLREVMAKRHVFLNSGAYTVLVKSAFTRGDLQAAKQLYNDICVDRNLRTDYVLWAELAYGFANGGWTQDFRKVLRKMSQDNKAIFPWKTNVGILQILSRRNEAMACREFVEFVAHQQNGVRGSSSTPKEESFWELAANVGGQGWAAKMRARA